MLLALPTLIRRLDLTRVRTLALLASIPLAVILLIPGCGGETTSEPDATPPAAVGDLAAQSTGCDAVSLTWTSPGDDGSQGRATSYDVRRSTATITEGNWGSAVLCVNEPVPKTAGGAEALAVGALTAGTTYYFGLKTTDDAGNVSALSNICNTVVGSLDIEWVNDGLGADEEWVVSLTELEANWAGACADAYEYAIGASAGATDVVPWTSTGTATYVTRSGLTLADGHTYYFSARGVRGATTGAPTSSDGVTVDYNVPSSSVNPLPAEVTALTFTVSWSGTDATSSIKWYDIQAKDGNGDWTDWLTGTALTSSGFTGVDGHIYYFRSRAWDNAGNDEAYPASADASTTVNLAGKPQVAWVRDGLFGDVDWTNSTTTLSAEWAPATGGDGYEYAIGSSAGGADVADWTSAGTQTQVTHSGLALAEGQKCYFSVRVTVGAAHGAAVSSDGITVDITLPTSSIDPLPAVVTTERFLVTWTGRDALSGIWAYNIQYKDGDGEWGDIYGFNPATSFNFPAEDGHTYYLRSRAFDNAGNVEAFPDVPDAFTTVALPPVPQIAWVNDGLGADVDWSGGDIWNVELAANWAGAPGVDGYQEAIGTAPGDSSIMTWVYAGTDTFASAWEFDDPVTEGSTYYFSVRGFIGSRHGDWTSSDGVRLDLTDPTSSVDSLSEITNTKVFNVSWSGTDTPSGLKSYTIRVRDGGDGSGEYQDWLTATTQTSADFTAEDGHTYYFQSQATDSAGNQEDIHASADAWTTVTCAYVFHRKWGSEGIGDGEFDGAGGIAVDGSSNVWVTDIGNDRVQKFSTVGVYLGELGSPGTGDGEMFRPWDVAIDDSGYIYVVETNHRIQKFTSAGSFSKKWGSWGPEEGNLKSAVALDVDDSGYVYVADTGNHRVQKFTSKGGFVKAWGDSGSGEGQFSNPRGLAVDGSGIVYVSDADNRTIQKFASDGTRIGGWGCWGGAEGCLNRPTAIALDDSGYVYVADTYNQRIQKFTAQGEFVATWGTWGTGDGELQWPQGIAVGDSGHIYTTEPNLNRIQEFGWSCP
jgi:hypothetical protein